MLALAPGIPQAGLPTPTRTGAQSPARIGVFICQCEGEIGSAVDTARLAAGAAALPGVIFSGVIPSACAPEAAGRGAGAVEAHALNRLVLAACSCCNRSEICESCTYTRVRCRQNLGVFSPRGAPQAILPASQMEFANLRELCSRVHPASPAEAEAKAAALLAASTALAALPVRNPAGRTPAVEQVLILGSGAAAGVCGEILSGLGVQTGRIGELPGRLAAAGRATRLDFADLSLKVSALVLAPGNPAETRQTAHLLEESGLPAAHLRAPANPAAPRRAVLVCDSGLDPETAGAAAAARVAAWLACTRLPSPEAAEVNPALCRACGTCMQVCSFGAAFIEEQDGRCAAWIDPAVCTGCGICAAHCPSGAIRDLRAETALAALLAAGGQPL